MNPARTEKYFERTWTEEYSAITYLIVLEWEYSMNLYAIKFFSVNYIYALNKNYIIK